MTNTTIQYDNIIIIIIVASASTRRPGPRGRGQEPANGCAANGWAFGTSSGPQGVHSPSGPVGEHTLWEHTPCGAHSRRALCIESNISIPYHPPSAFWHSAWCPCSKPWVEEACAGHCLSFVGWNAQSVQPMPFPWPEEYVIWSLKWKYVDIVNNVKSLNIKV